MICKYFWPESGTLALNAPHTTCIADVQRIVLHSGQCTQAVVTGAFLLNDTLESKYTYTVLSVNRCSGLLFVSVCESWKGFSSSLKLIPLIVCSSLLKILNCVLRSNK